MPNYSVAWSCLKVVNKNIGPIYIKISNNKNIITIINIINISTISTITVIVTIVQIVQIVHIVRIGVITQSGTVIVARFVDLE